MEQTTTIVDFVHRFQEIQQHRDASENLVRDLLVYCDRVESTMRLQNKKLAEELQLCKLDIVDATNSRRDLQQRLQTSEAQAEWIIKENDDLKNRNSYILVAIDGDEMIFRDRWIHQGVEGGKKAAQALRSAIEEHCGNRSADIHIVAKVYADLAGLGKNLSRDGRPDLQSDLRNFVIGFNQAQATFDFVDIGPQKNAASSKIKETAKWHLQNQNCKYVILGISRDEKCVSFVEELLANEDTLQCVSVIEGFPTAKELVDTGINILDIGKDLFRSEPLSSRNSSTVTSPWASTYSGTASPTASVVSSNTPSTATMSYALAISSSSTPPPPSGVVLAAAKPLSAPARPRAHVQYQQVPPQQPDWNPGPRGLDEPIMVSVAALENIKKRKDKDKLCNNHFLRGPCAKGDLCHFVHSYKPSTDEINAIAVLARQNPCTIGQDCVLDDCIYGHHVSTFDWYLNFLDSPIDPAIFYMQCPSVKDGTCCHPFCKFPEELHPPGTKFKNAYIRAN
ncbi:hypothetical protein HIM_00184 [Hirsutella minnesotensis 3608]|nr:hypothetical protein HIM_00184 [Hirsutella minnesotensis 3608]